ncbi:hypothetical protein [Haloplanus halobius]|nr:hypothetical protein [Haloplanus sp. XH21]
MGAIAALLVVVFFEYPSAAHVALLRAVAIGLAMGYVAVMVVRWCRLDA